MIFSKYDLNDRGDQKYFFGPDSYVVGWPYDPYIEIFQKFSVFFKIFFRTFWNFFFIIIWPLETFSHLEIFWKFFFEIFDFFKFLGCFDIFWPDRNFFFSDRKKIFFLIFLKSSKNYFPKTQMSNFWNFLQKVDPQGNDIYKVQVFM